ncbi:Peptide-N(4)-(N-acetyl-beta-glucosaminyl)asparagine amidase [Pseudolycoriella hygida]|uniref:Peptide-N(4)-(N-acetyl-beta-glucosaminyl)asparagine amidase n=1 Tax=Pseudolycoriella hygida TaxID=35572 RepID=A0A9Q0N6X6_9DIPT|nr:Peptide-N(4)-(N-acetyl-beta-glucosaminyl)asparagine amidase [Pseudolycoriella hygida]
MASSVIDEALLLNLERLNSKERYCECVVILLKLLDNVIREPQNNKYRVVRLENKVIKEKLLCLNGIRQLLTNIGFEEVEGELRLPGNLMIAKLKKCRDVINKRLESVKQTAEVVASSSQAPTSSSTPPTQSVPDIRIKVITPQKPFQQRITFPSVIPFNNQFLKHLETLSDLSMQYEDTKIQKYATSLIPLDRLVYNSTKRLRLIQKEIASKGCSKSAEICLTDLILCELSRWFNEEFFTWVNSMPCRVCGNDDVQTRGKTKDGGIDVETYTCCNVTSKFYRFNDVAILLTTRRGRCGEYANCFTLLCRCLGYDARICYATFDHVWTEVYSVYQKRWIHIDPSDNVIDAPLMYQHGWKRKVDYVIAFSRDDVQDVTWRYANNHKETLSSRTKCSESNLLQTIILLRNKRRMKISPARCRYLTKRSLSELCEFFTEREVTENERKGRSSGSMSWKASRGEQNVNNFFVITGDKNVVQTKQFNLRYSCAENIYEKYIIVGDQKKVYSQSKKWESYYYLSNHIFRKEERDWKMVYLARIEDTEAASISWNFDFSKDNLIINSISLRFETKSYEDGSVVVETWNEQRKPVKIDELCGKSKFSICVFMKGGKGEVAWQHTQLFRQRIGSKDYPFDLNITFD